MIASSHVTQSLLKDSDQFTGELVLPYHATYSEKINETFWPPNPKLFDNDTPGSHGRGEPSTRSRALNAGSTAVVHAVGGWIALPAVLLLGARYNRYRKDGAMSAHPPSSIPFLALGAWILIVGWFGFNVMSAQTLKSVTGLVAMNSLMAMCGGIIGAACGPRGPTQGKSQRWWLALGYNAGRITTYAAGGALAGALGEAGLALRGGVAVQQMAMALAGRLLVMQPVL